MLSHGSTISGVLLTCLGFVSLAAAAEPVRREWIVAGVAREALVCVPPQARTNAVPVVFVFHGHGGTMEHASRVFSLHTLWPEALVVYMQGIPTPGRLTDPEGRKAGWQNVPGDHGDRDLKFFDAVLEGLRAEYSIDEKHVFATGHSNGGGFTYLLWATRPHAFDAFAPCAAVTMQLNRLLPKPALHIAGENDTLVKYAWQQKTMDALRKINKCGEGRPWGNGGTIYTSAADAPLITLIHPGGHGFPDGGAEAIVQFFKGRVNPK